MQIDCEGDVVLSFDLFYGAYRSINGISFVVIVVVVAVARFSLISVNRWTGSSKMNR